ncbi:unnamed protein product [Caenorhabditis nigoni]
MSSESEFTQRIFGYVYVLYCIVVSCEVISIPKGRGILKEWKVQNLPKVQNLNHVISGFFGMISSVWIAFGCLLALSSGFRALIFCSIYMLALCFFIVSYLMISNVLTHLYLILPSENQPFFTKFWPICVLLLLSSFVFSINAWSCVFTPSYILCEHREYEEDMLKSPGIICHVAVRRNLGKMKDPMNLPIGFQFDDQLDVSGLQYKVLKSYK